MVQSIQSRTRLLIRESIGYNLQDMTLVVATSTVDTTSLLATKSLGRGGDDEYNGREVVCVTPTGSIVAGETSLITDFAAATADATCAPAFTANITTADIFEMWRVFTYAEINDAINQSIMEATDDCPQIKIIDSIFTEDKKYEYDVLSSFVGLHRVEYVKDKGFYHLLDTADSVWTAGSANVTVTADTSFLKEGDASSKAVEDGNSGAGAKLSYVAISSVDISDTDKVEFWMYSSIALTAGQLQIHMSSTAAIASAEETIDIPAMSAATWYRHSLSLENPQSDTAIISVGIYQVSDVGAFTFYVDMVETAHSTSKVYDDIPRELWDIVKGSTRYLKLTQNGLGLVGTSTQLRLTGHQIPALISADATASEIDPFYIIALTTGNLLLSHAKSNRLDIKDRQSLGDRWLARAARMKPSIMTQIPPNYRSVL